MLKGVGEAVDLKEKAKELIPQISDKLQDIRLEFGEQAVEQLDENVVNLHYPVMQYLNKISSFNFDKQPIISGTLLGIKGQYLIFDTGVINIRKFTSYHISVDY